MDIQVSCYYLEYSIINHGLLIIIIYTPYIELIMKTRNI